MLISGGEATRQSMQRFAAEVMPAFRRDAEPHEVWLFEQHKRLTVQPGHLDRRPEKAARQEVEGHDVVLADAVR